MANLWRDARYGFRLLRKSPEFTTVAVMALAIGIAANTAIFSVVYATLLAPLPYPQPNQLVMVWSSVQDHRNGIAAGDFVEWRRQATVFQDLTAWTGRSVNLSTGDHPENVQGRAITPGFLSMVGYDFALGRDFRQEEGTFGRDQSVILSHKLWQRRFASDPAIVGHEVRIDGKPFTVVGVLAAGAADRLEDLIWVPLAFTPEQLNHDAHWLLAMGRLKPGVTLEQANANMAAVAKRLAEAYPTSNGGWTTKVEPLKNDFLDGGTKASLWLMLGAVGFVLLIACANVANLLLARGTARQRELAIRASLGATRSEIVRQFITESVVLALLGGLLGVALAAGLLHVIVAAMPPYTLPSEADVQLNLPVLLFTLGACALSGVLFGCAPAWQGTQANTNDALKETGRSVVGGRHRLQRILVIAEFALALTLLSGGGLAIHSLVGISHVNLGFRVERLLTFSLPIPQGKLVGNDQIQAFYGPLLERLKAVPSVTSVSVSTGMPVRGTNFGMQFSLAGKPFANPSERPGAGFNMVSTDYYKTFGIKMARGRAFTDQDRGGTLPVAIVNDTFAKRYLTGVDPLSQRLVISELSAGLLKLGPPIEWQIVGVYNDVKNAGPKDDGFPEIDVPFAQDPWPGGNIAVRTAGDPLAVRQSLANVVTSMDSDLPMADVKTMEAIVNDSMSTDRFTTMLFGGFAGVALLLAGFGIYGVMSFVVAQRRHEIGLRMALGAGRGRVLRQVLREGMTTALAGTVLGAIGAYFVGRAMRGLVVGVGVIDPLALSLVTLTLLTTALVACLVPAARAASVDPMVALRQD